MLPAALIKFKFKKTPHFIVFNHHHHKKKKHLKLAFAGTTHSKRVRALTSHEERGQLCEIVFFFFPHLIHPFTHRALFSGPNNRTLRFPPSCPDKRERQKQKDTEGEKRRRTRRGEDWLDYGTRASYTVERIPTMLEKNRQGDLFTGHVE